MRGFLRGWFRHFVLLLRKQGLYAAMGLLFIPVLDGFGHSFSLYARIAVPYLLIALGIFALAACVNYQMEAPTKLPERKSRKPRKSRTSRAGQSRDTTTK